MASKKLSGAARRKAAREAGLLAGSNSRARGEYVPKPVIGRLETVSDVARELRRVFHEVRSKILPADQGAKEAFVGTQALKATEVEMELANQAAIIAALEAQQQRSHDLTNGHLHPALVYTPVEQSTDGFEASK